MRRLAFVLATLVAFAAAAPATAGAAGPSAVTYRPPVDAPIVDPFRPPAENWNAGNRGIEYATTPGTLVGAAAAGEVVFAGPVADGLHVVVLHDDGLRTSYSFLALVAVHRGDKVTQGQTVGTTQERFHFGVRAGDDVYLDPAKLFGGGPPEVYLVPAEQRRPQTEAKERAGIARMFPNFAARVVAGGAAAFDWAKDHAVDMAEAKIADKVDEIRGAAHYLNALRPSAHLERFAAAAKAWMEARKHCTAASVPAPTPSERHILVRVGGLDSTSKEAAIDGLDGKALGYADADDVRFSYKGGTTDEHSYETGDTDGDIRESARRLRDLLARIEAANPGVPIDIVAHSEGGLVARSALTYEGDAADPRLPQVNSLVTLATPHLGAPAATAAAMLDHTRSGTLALMAGHAALPDHIDPRGTAVKQMAEHSLYLADLNRKPLPAGVKFTSIGAREDPLVPATQTMAPGAENVTISAPGFIDEHRDMASSPQAQREVALGIAGLPPTCQSFGDALADAVVSDFIYSAEEGLGAVAWGGIRYLERRDQGGPLTSTPVRPEP